MCSMEIQIAVGAHVDLMRPIYHFTPSKSKIQTSNANWAEICIAHRMLSNVADNQRNIVNFSQRVLNNDRNSTELKKKPCHAISDLYGKTGIWQKTNGIDWYNKA